MRSAGKVAGNSITTAQLAVRALSLCALLLAFDFKGKEAGGLYQVVSFLIVAGMLAATALLLATRPVGFGDKRSQRVLHALAFYLISTVLTAVIQRVPLTNYATVIAPMLLFVGAFCVVSGLCRRYDAIWALRRIFPAVRVMLFCSVVWTLLYGLSADGTTVATARYRVVSPLMPVAVAFIASGLFARKLTKIDSALAVLLMVVIAISQTRIYLVVGLIAIAAAAFAYARTTRYWLTLVRRLAIAGGTLLLIAAVGTSAVTSLLPSGGGDSLASMWKRRLVAEPMQAGFDLTTETRLAEYSDQMQKLRNSSTSMLIGNGFGSGYSYSGIHADRVSAVLGEDAIPINYWNGGHSLFLYPLYASGMLFFPLFLFVIVSGLMVATKLLKKTRALVDADLKHIVITFAVGYLCLIATGLTAYPLGSRSAAFVLGLCLAANLGVYRAFARQ